MQKNLARRPEEWPAAADHDGESPRFCVIPNGNVRILLQSFEHDMGGFGKQVREAGDQPARKVLIEEKLHRATRRPTRAAYS